TAAIQPAAAIDPAERASLRIFMTNRSPMRCPKLVGHFHLPSTFRAPSEFSWISGRTCIDVGAVGSESRCMLIGSVGQFQTSLPPGECSQRLNGKLGRFSFGSRADIAGFGLAKS